MLDKGKYRKEEESVKCIGRGEGENNASTCPKTHCLEAWAKGMHEAELLNAHPVTDRVRVRCSMTGLHEQGMPNSTSLATRRSGRALTGHNVLLQAFKEATESSWERRPRPCGP